MPTTSLDPRINRMALATDVTPSEKPPLDQFGTWEVFVQARDNKPPEHAGIVHAPDAEMAFLFAKEQYSRRGRGCVGLAVVPTDAVWVSAYVEGDQNAYDALPPAGPAAGASEAYVVFHLQKRGKQHQFAGMVEAADPPAAAHAARKTLGAEVPLNVWIAPAAAMHASDEEDRDFWTTLPEKKYRDATAYKTTDKLKAFQARQGG
ncbi:MAG: phenylacetic acid degradation b [Catalinimonas sp.]